MNRVDTPNFSVLPEGQGNDIMAHVRKQQITFILATRCNLKCRYCYTKKNPDVKKEHQRLDLNFAKRALNDFFRDYSSRQIRFYAAGEPTCEFNLMKDIRDYAYELAGGELEVELQTNGYFKKRVAEWVLRNVDILWISCDGPPDIQDDQRPKKPKPGGRPGPSSWLVEHNLKLFAGQEHMQLGVRVTVTAPTIQRQTEIVAYFHELGIRYVNVHPACAPVEGSSDQIFQWDPIDFAENFLESRSYAEKLGIFYNSLYTANFDEETRHACRACIPYPQITTDGYVSCCDFSQFGPEYAQGPLQQLIYGKYIPEDDRIAYDEDKIHEIRSRCAENLEKGPCRGCKFIYHCAGGCLGQVVNETGDLMGIHERNCRITKYLAERMPLAQRLNPVLHS